MFRPNVSTLPNLMLITTIIGVLLFTFLSFCWRVWRYPRASKYLVKCLIRSPKSITGMLDFPGVLEGMCKKFFSISLPAAGPDDPIRAWCLAAFTLLSDPKLKAHLHYGLIHETFPTPEGLRTEVKSTVWIEYTYRCRSYVGYMAEHGMSVHDKSIFFLRMLYCELSPRCDPQDALPAIAKLYFDMQITRLYSDMQIAP